MKLSLIASVVAVACAAESKSLLSRPRDTGMMPRRGRRMLTDEHGEINLGAILDTEDMPDTNTYPGEDEQREIANDAVMHWKNGDRKPVVVNVGQHSRLYHPEFYN